MPPMPMNAAAFGSDNGAGPFKGAGRGGLNQMADLANEVDDEEGLSSDEQVGTPFAEPPQGGLAQAKEMGTLDPQQINQLVMRMRSTSARDMYTQALQAMISKKPEQGRLNLAALQMAGALLRPTKTGTFAEAMGNAIPEGVQAQVYQDKLGQEQEDKKDNLRLKMLEGASNDERTKESELMKLMSTLYGKQGFRYSTVKGNFLRHPNGQDEYLGPLTPQQQGSSAQMYEKTEDKLAAERDGKFYDDVMQKGQSAQAMNKTIEPLMVLLKNSDFQGAAAPYLTNIESVMQTVGIDPKVFNLKGAGPAEATRGLTARLVLDQTGGKLGAGISNSDVSFLNSTVPNIENTDQSNKILAELLTRINNRQSEVMEFAYDYENSHNGVKGLKQAINERFGTQSIFDDGFTKADLTRLAAKDDKNTLGSFIKSTGASSVNPAYQVELDFRRGKYGDPTTDAAKKKRDELLKPHGF